MQRRKKDIVLLCVSIGCFFLMSLSFLVMPLKIPNIEPKVLSVIIGLMFWGFMIIGIIMQVVLAQRRNAWIRKNHLRRNHNISCAKIGLIVFAQNNFGFIADIMCVLSFISMIIALVITKSVGYACYITLAIFVFAFCMHCILNGKIFYYIQNQNKILQESETE